MKRNPERLAWAVLMISCFTCIALAVAVPVGARYYTLLARVPQNVTLEVQKGPLRVRLAGQGEPVAIAEKRDEIPERTSVATDSTLGRLVMHAPRTAEHPVLATVQLYYNTEATLLSARSPRFPASHLAHKVALDVVTGRVRINLSNTADRPTIVEVHTPQGTVELTAGSYEVRVTAATTEVTVHYGQAEASDKMKHAVTLGPAERAVIDARQISSPLPAAPNLVADGDFVASAAGEWSIYSKDVEPPGESGGEAHRTEIDGHPAVVITRRGTNHAETGITQTLDADVSNLSFLQLHLLLRVAEQDVPVCGSKGSECPVMVRINYQDANGADQEWLQGFYWLPDTNSPGNPTVCVTCSTRNEHIQVPQGIWYPYLSPNLIPLLSQNGRPPLMVKSITIYASGHTYQSMVTEVELTGQ